MSKDELGQHANDNV